MICNKCNKPIEDGTRFCTYCGAVQEISSPESQATVVEPILAEEKEQEKVVEAVNAETSAEPKASLEKAEEAVINEDEGKSEKKSKKEKIEKNEQNKLEKKEKEKKEKKAKEKKAQKVKDESEEEYEVISTKEGSPKSKDRVNFFFLLLTLLCPPYFGVLITICTSAKAPKATQVYGIFTILSFIFMKIKNYILTIFATIFVVLGVIAALLSGAYILLSELGYDMSFVTNAISTLF